MIALQIFFLLLKAFILSPVSKPHSIIIKALLNKHSYRFPASMQTNYKAPVHYLRHVLFFIFKKKRKKNLTFGENQSIGIFDGKYDSISDRYAYLKQLETPLPGFGISRDNLKIKGFFSKVEALIGVLILTFLFTPIIILSSKRKGTISLILLEYVEWVALFQFLNARKCNYLYHFCAYEKDAGIIGWICSKKGIINHKVPSSNPLKNFYKNIYCDILSITTPFQKPEIEKLSHNWRVKKIVVWPIENFQKLQPFYNVEPNSKKEFQLGFLSSGIWLRQKQGHSPLGTGDQESELALLEILKEFLSKNRSISFIVLLHPIEKKSIEVYEEACNHYRNLFDGINLYFGNKEKSSYEYFSVTDTTIAAYSSTNLQRLFCGYKTLYAPLKFQTKLYEHSDIEKIIALDKNSLFELLYTTLKLSEKDFFNYNNLMEYHFFAYQSLTNKSLIV